MNLQERILACLLHMPETRNNDRTLVVEIWGERFTIKKYLQGEYPNHDTITRIKRRLQSAIPSLRGKKRKRKNNPRFGVWI